MSWDSPAQWWEDEVDRAGARRAELEAAKETVVLAGCPDVVVFEELHNLQQHVSASTETWERYAGQFRDAREGLDTAAALLAKAVDTSVLLQMAAPEGNSPFRHTPLLTFPDDSKLRTALSEFEAFCRKQARRQRRQRQRGIYEIRDRCVDEILKRTGRRFPAGAIATLITTTTGLRVTAASLRMARSRRGKRVKDRLVPPKRVVSRSKKGRPVALKKVWRQATSEPGVE